MLLDEFAVAIVGAGGMDCPVPPDLHRRDPVAARRPANSVLVSERGAPGLPDWQAGLEQFMSEMAEMRA